MYPCSMRNKTSHPLKSNSSTYRKITAILWFRAKKRHWLNPTKRPVPQIFLQETLNRARNLAYMWYPRPIFRFPAYLTRAWWDGLFSLRFPAAPPPLISSPPRHPPSPRCLIAAMEHPVRPCHFLSKMSEFAHNECAHTYFLAILWM
jgi:hypothetical protein